ncbi:MAG: hypothetical protein ISS72_10450 [Candidatus Brocadiae bacterium]|nr:hypothetical protein [Candidatus Brocadiia bacterium]
MQFRQPRCPKCGSWPTRMAGVVPTSMHIYRVDDNGTELDEDAHPDMAEFEHDGSDVCWEYEDHEYTPDGKVRLFCPGIHCKQGEWLSEIVPMEEEALRANAHDAYDALLADIGKECYCDTFIVNYPKLGPCPLCQLRTALGIKMAQAGS